MSDVIETIKKRSSTRGYTEEPLTEAELDALLHAGLQAPTAANKQEIHFTVLDGGHPILRELEEEKQKERREMGGRGSEGTRLLVLYADY